MRQPKPFYRNQTRSFYVQLDGRQINLGPDEAEAYRRWHLLMAGANEAVIEAMNEPIDKPQAITVQQLVKRYLGWQDGQSKLKPRTKEWYKSHLKSFESVAGNRVAEEINQDDVDRWFAKCGEGWGDNYRLGCYRALSRLYNWGRKRGIVAKNPIRDMERPSYEPRDCYLTAEQWKTIIAKAGPEFADILTFIKHTGCRPFEARWAEARHFNGKCIVFDRKNSKGKKTRRVLILDEVSLAIVKRRIEKQGDGPIFRKQNGSAWSSQNLSQYCARLAVKVKIPFSAYTLRHTAASNLLVATGSDVATATILGHSDVSMLKKVYGHLDKHPEHLKWLLDEANGAA
jgi:integrase